MTVVTSWIDGTMGPQSAEATQLWDPRTTGPQHAKATELWILGPWGHRMLKTQNCGILELLDHSVREPWTQGDVVTSQQKLRTMGEATGPQGELRHGTGVSYI